MPNAVGDWPESVHVWPGWPRMMRLLLTEVAFWLRHENWALLFAPKGFAVIVLLPAFTVSPVLAIPHCPLHE
jgi:hypothetical protein